ncbi:alpha/beta fold hydrolase [Rhodococcus sp. IEGM 1307]|uniref:alpha/beta fold hydrolase n=1 Tax=Rhodococcus sp. IEGM 1307 TaxID=3047091 RepID=UPI0024B6CCFD|nr:alpha/beta fold hydrolase [Rhodococcus sp. IEGM 1307]MDI9977180.1 alpha/beta fold hydrolase [Rhodococcus sp. IEGM 1307]
MPRISVNGYDTWYEDDCFCDPWRTDIETILIQPGFGRNSQFWYHWIPRLAGRYRVIRRDLRGHGKSADGGTAPWTFDQLVDDLSRFIDVLSLGRVHVLGESTGGMLAVGLAHGHPDQVQSLTLCSSPTTIDGAGQQFFAGSHNTWQDALESLGAEGFAKWLVSQTGTAVCEDALQSQWWIDQFSSASTTALIGYSTVISGVDVAPLLPQLTVPSLVLAPTRSSATSLLEQLSIAAAIPGARVVTVDGAGHEIYADEADVTSAAYLNFLENQAGNDSAES